MASEEHGRVSTAWDLYDIAEGEYDPACDRGAESVRGTGKNLYAKMALVYKDTLS